MSTSENHNTGRLKLILHLLFLVSGTVTVIIGQLLPYLARRFELSDLQLSLYFPAQFAGSLVGTIINSRFAKQNRFVTASLIGAALMSIGTLAMSSPTFPLTLLAFFINGVGIGITLPAINLAIIGLKPKNPASALSALNFCWGVGAIVCKPFVDFSSSDDSVLYSTLILAAALALCAAFLLLHREVNHFGSEIDTDDTPSERIWLTPIAWAIAAFNFVHVGFESGMGGWLTVYAERLDNGSVGQFWTPTLLYFLLFVAGRAIAPLFFRLLNENSMILLGLAIILAGMLLALTANNIATLTVGSAISGFGTSWIFPTNITRFSNTLGKAAAMSSTPLFICGTLGAASSTWLIGFISDRLGGLRSGMFVLLASVVILFVLQVIIMLKQKTIRP